MSILEKGMKFTPTPLNANNQEIKDDRAEFTRRVRLVEYFHGCDDKDESLVRNKSHFLPPKNRNEALDQFINNVESIPLDKSSTKPKSNISKYERKAITTLTSDKNIIIKEADKGGGIVIMNTDHYKTMSENIISDKSFYETLPDNPERNVRLNYNKLLKKYSNCLTDKERVYLQDFEVKDSQFYGLPKIHKSEKITTACEQSKSKLVNVKNVDDLKL